MKKYKFKLEALLKMRVFKEKKIKQEIGEIVSEIENCKKKIAKMNSDIGKGYESQEGIVNSTVPGRMLQFYPSFFEAKYKEIENAKKLISSLEDIYEDKLQELKMAMGEVKVVENMKEKDKTSFKKHIMKKEQEDIEELLQYKKQTGAI